MNARMTINVVVTITMFPLLMLSGHTLVSGYQLPDTGQDKCYDNNSEITCPSPGQPFYGQDAQHDGPQPSYNDNGDGTVTDLNTGLMWQQGDSQNEFGKTWQTARDYCTNLTLSQYSDWRLPNIRELVSLVDYGHMFPAIDTNYFPNCEYGGGSGYWSSSLPHNLSAYNVNFSSGVNGIEMLSYYGFVRCVRKDTPTPSYEDNGGGTVTDLATGLIWQKGDNQNDAGARTWEEALAYCNGLPTTSAPGQQYWRLPNVRELQSIVDWEKSPSIDPIFECRSSTYWSSTTEAQVVISPFDAFAVNFDYAVVESASKPYESHCVRCVQGPIVSLRYVAPDGFCGGKFPCYTSIQDAINAANTDCDIRITQGSYLESITLRASISITLQGGWNSSYTTQTSNTTFIKSPQAPQGSITLQMVTVRP
jgi:hypothetical protein